MQYLTTILFLVFISYAGISQNAKPDTEDEDEQFDYQVKPFMLIKKWPEIKDTGVFIRELKANCHLAVQGIYPRYGEKVLYETINLFIKTKLNGSNRQYYIIEYDWHGNFPNVASPWKRQFLFDASGKLITIMSALKIRLLRIFPNENLFW